MHKGVIFTILICFSFLFCSAQVDPNAMNDSINIMTKRMNDSINAGAKRMNESINRIDDSIRKTIIENQKQVSLQQHLIPLRDSTVFDSLHGKLFISIRNINKIGGNLNIALFNSIKSFLNDGPVFRGAIVPVTSLNMAITFDSLPQGVYSIAVFHDADKNGKLARNKLNIPTEGYGFSNLLSVEFTPPNYNQTKFYYSGKNKHITINMMYIKFP